MPIYYSAVVILAHSQHCGQAIHTTAAASPLRCLSTVRCQISSLEPRAARLSFYNEVMSSYQGYKRGTPLPVLAALILTVTLCLSGVYCAPSENNGRNRKILVQQKKDLDALKCEPKLTMVPLAGALEFHDALADHDFFPKVVAVHRCIESCSFCGNSAMGTPSGKCLPLETKKRPFLAFYIKDSKRIFQEVLVEEHMACSCSS